VQTWQEVLAQYNALLHKKQTEQERAAVYEALGGESVVR